MKKSTFLLLLLFPLSSFCQSATRQYHIDQALQKSIPAIFSLADGQYSYMMGQLRPGEFPRSYNAASRTLVTSGSGWWCSGFYPASLLLIYEQKKDPKLLQEAQRILKTLNVEQFNTSTHDLGFMMYNSFGAALRNEAKQEYQSILLNSAKSLASRFNPTVGCIKSWDSIDPAVFQVIIDNMMNLELLFWATRFSGDSSYYKMAVNHADHTLKNHFRNDFSSFHVVRYDAHTGAVTQRLTNQGYADQSAWARGQAWGLYGFTVMFRETGDDRYLKRANAIAAFLLVHGTIPEDGIPYWDLNAPNRPYALRDASAAAIIAAALLELCRYTNDRATGQKYVDAATVILKTLSSKKYLASLNDNGGFLLKHSVGNMPAQSEIDVPLTYADYYYLEALKRCKELSANVN